MKFSAVVFSADEFVLSSGNQTSMTIQPVHLNLLEEVVQLFRDCRKALEEESVFQWTDSYPNGEIIKQDIESSHLYGIFYQNKCRGVICLNTIQDAEYNSSQWQDTSGLFLVVHRLAISPTYQKSGFATQLMDFAEELALERGFKSIRLDVYRDNSRALKLYKSRGYEFRGEVNFPGRDLPFICMEKMLSG